jgi:hypothetical protein|tara:strand:+ start:571 stop:1392 length:822 start_codon:yes stop_codon:yes gene_type:complete
MFAHFDNKSIRNLVVAFGSLFNNCYVKRYNADGSEKETIRVPLAYGNKEKYLRRIDEGGSITTGDGSQVALVLPRMSFDITSIDYDPIRKRNTMERYAKRDPDSDSSMNYSYSEVPYIIDFNLYIMAKFMGDGLQIMEQILPYFTPEFTVSINPTEQNRKVDIPIVLNSVQPEEDWEGDFESRRSITWTLGFTAKSYIYGRIVSGAIIKEIQTTLLNYTSNEAGTTGAFSRTDVGVTGPSGASSDVSNYTPTITKYAFGSTAGDIDIDGEIIE